MGRWVQVRPNATAYKDAQWYASGIWGDPGGGAHGYVNDNNDGTWLYGVGSGSLLMELHLGDWGLAGDERCAGAHLITRMRGTGFGPFNLDAWLRPVNIGDGAATNYGNRPDWPNWETHWGPDDWREYDQATMNATKVCYRMNGAPTTTPSISEVYVEYYLQNRPTVTITSPAWASTVFPVRPTITWNYDSKGDGVMGWRMKVFTQAVAEGGGFNQDTSATVYDTGDVGGAANSAQVGVDLTQGATYYAYVQLATNFLGGWWRSIWMGTKFKINSPSTPSAVTVTPATPITTTNRPTIGWTYADPDADAQEYYYVRVFPESVYSQPGFTPNAEAGAAWASGAVADSAARSAQTGPLSPNVNYKAWVYTADLGSGQRWSTPVAGGVFVITTAPGIITDPPAVPEVKGVTTDQDNQRLAVTLTGRDNILTRNGASIDTGLLGWSSVGVSTILTRDTVTFLQGGASLAMTPQVTGGDAKARTTSGGTGLMPVTAGRTYTGLGSVRAGATSVVKNCHVEIAWYNASNALISTTVGASAADAVATWTQLVATGVAPAGAVWADVVLVLESVTSGQTHYWDNLSFAPGSSMTWTRGGLAYEIRPLYDTFTRANSATVLGTSDSGHAWTAHKGTWGINGNRAYLATGTDQQIDHTAVLSSSYLADGYVEADITLSAVRACAGLSFRAASNTDQLVVRLYKVAGTDAINLYKAVGSAWTLLASVDAAGLTLGTTYKLRIEFFGGQVYVLVNGQQRISYLMLAGELAQFGAYGGYGMMSCWSIAQPPYDDGGSRWDNFKVGLLPTQQITLERSLDAGVTWERVRNAVNLHPEGQEAIVWDYEVPAGVLAQYRAITTASEKGNVVTSAYSAVMAQSVALTIDTWWLKDAVDPALNMTIKVAPPFQFRRKESMAVFDPVGRNTSVFVTDGPKGIEGTLNVWSKDRATYDKLVAILGTGRPLLLQDPLGRSWWVKFADQDWDLQRAQPQATETTPIRHFHGLSLPFSEVAAPAVV